MSQITLFLQIKHRYWPIAIWSLITTFVLWAVASFLLKHLSTGQTFALFALAFLEVLIIRAIARMDRLADTFETLSPTEE